jgi:hypothetical protein
MCSLALIIFVVSEKKAFEHFPIGSNVNLCIAVVDSNAFFSETTNIIKAKLYMNVHWMVLYKLYGSNVKLSPAVAAILNFISEQKTLRL